MKAPGAKETLNWGFVGLIGMGLFAIASKMGMLPSLGSLFGIGENTGSSNEADYRNEQLEQINKELDRATQEATERQIYWIEQRDRLELRGYFFYHPEQAQILDDHLNNLQEYQQAMAAYNNDPEDRAQVERIMATHGEYLESRQAAISLLQRLTA